MSANSSNAQIQFLEETVAGTVPTGDPQILRFTSESLDQTIEARDSEEIRDDRMVAGMNIISGSAAGAINFEFSHKTFDAFLESLVAGVYVPVGANGVITVADAVFANSGNTLTSAGAGLPADLEKGQWFTIAGAVNSANNGAFRVSTTVAPTTTSITLDSANDRDFADESSVSVTLSSRRLKNAKETLRTFTVEKIFTDVSQYFCFTGMGVKSLSLNLALSSPSTGSFNFIGMQCARGTTTQFSGTPVAQTTTDVMNTVDGTSVILDGIAANDTCVESINLSVDSGLRERRCLGSGIGASSLGVGTFKVTANTEIFFGNVDVAAVWDKMTTGQDISLSTCVTAPDGTGMGITLATTGIKSCKVVAGGIDTDVVMSLQLSSIRDVDTNSVIIFDSLGTTA